MTSAPHAGLIEAAVAARVHARCEQSGFAVGAAIESADGRVFTGCNIENASYGLTICAERVALFKALSEGVSAFRAVAVVTAASTLTPPCGACRQLLWEFGGDLEVILASTLASPEESCPEIYRMKDLLPHAFDARSLR